MAPAGIFHHAQVWFTPRLRITKQKTTKKGKPKITRKENEKAPKRKRN
jgi:hypothetical protein